MDGFFGIGIGELVLIAIVALIVLGPERLPGALREVAKFVRWLRDLSREFTDQFGDEFKALEDLNPRRILQDAITSIDEEEKAKEAPKSVKKPVTPTTAKPTPAKSATTTGTTTTGTKTTTASPPKPKPVTPTAVDSSTTVARDTTTAQSTTGTSESAQDSVTTNTALIADGAENRIAPPAVEAGMDVIVPARTNGHHPEAAHGDVTPSANEGTTPATSEPSTEHAIVVSHQQDGEVEQREG